MSAPTTWGSWATARPTSTASVKKARSSPTGTASRAARRTRRLHHRPVADPHRPDQGRTAWRRARPRPARSKCRGCPEDPRLRHRPVRQESPGRPQRVSATVHGFDEFFGNLYHLNAEEEPENPDYPKDPEFRAKFGPRGVLKCKASEHRRSDRGSRLRTSRQADDREHRPARHQAHGDH